MEYGMKPQEIDQQDNELIEFLDSKLGQGKYILIFPGEEGNSIITGQSSLFVAGTLANVTTNIIVELYNASKE